MVDKSTIVHSPTSRKHCYRNRMNCADNWGCAGWEKLGSHSLLELEAQVFACVGAEAAGALSKPDPLGAVLAPIAGLAVDLRLVSCDRGAVQSLPTGHCRREEGPEVGVRLLSTSLHLQSHVWGQETEQRGPRPRTL